MTIPTLLRAQAAEHAQAKALRLNADILRKAATRLADSADAEWFNALADAMVCAAEGIDLLTARVAELEGGLQIEYARHEADARTANFDRCGCGWCNRVRDLQAAAQWDIPNPGMK